MTFQLDTYEAEIIAGCMRNERMSQKSLYDRYCKAMYTIAYRIINDHDDAHDALQDGFIQVFRDLEKFKRESTLGAWIKPIIVRATLAKLKKKNIFEPIVADKEYDSEVIEWDSNMTGKQLEKAILSLPEGYRSVFVLTEVEGYSHNETSVMLGISEGTSRSQLFHAKKMLQKKLIDFKN